MTKEIKEIVMNKKAFTLIELLVVVLIIGILAAVAVPQYQKAVIKSRYTLLKTTTQTIVNAQERYYLANNTYTDNRSFLDIDIQGTNPSSPSHQFVFSWGTCSLLLITNEAATVCYNSQIRMQYQQYYSHSQWRHNEKVCIALNTDLASIQNQLCKQDSQRSTPSEMNSTNYTWRYN